MHNFLHTLGTKISATESSLQTARFSPTHPHEGIRDVHCTPDATGVVQPDTSGFVGPLGRMASEEMHTAKQVERPGCRWDGIKVNSRIKISTIFTGFRMATLGISYEHRQLYMGNFLSDCSSKSTQLHVLIYLHI
jgi:hypothetical protein